MEEEQRPIDRIRYALEKTPGIVSVSLPSTPQYSVKTGKIYRWYFRIVCNNGTNFAVGGLVQRVTLDSYEHNYSGYLTNRIWHDALTDLAERRRNAPQEPQLKKDWANLWKPRGSAWKGLLENPVLVL
jgi:hypothetical protein